MQRLSQSLEALSVEVKKLEDSAKATFEADRARLEKRRGEIDATLTAGRDDFESKVREAADAGRSWWNDTTTALARPVHELRARHDERKTEREVSRAMRIADAAEEDAAVAIDYATYWLHIAEYAVVDATLARMAADDLAMAADDSAAETDRAPDAGGVS